MSDQPKPPPGEQPKPPQEPQEPQPPPEPPPAAAQGKVHIIGPGEIQITGSSTAG